MFWLTLGAGLGISGYRRANRMVRELTRPASRYRLRQPRQVRGLAGFVRDVREGMELYAEQQRPATERHRSAERPTLGLQQVRSASRNGSAAH